VARRPVVVEGPHGTWRPLDQGDDARRGSHKLYESPPRLAAFTTAEETPVLLVPQGVEGWRAVGFNFANLGAAGASFAVFGTIGTIRVQVLGSPVLVAAGATGHLEVAELYAVLQVFARGTTAPTLVVASAQGVSGA